MKQAIIAVLLFFSVSTVLWAAEDKVSIQFENTGDTKILYYLYWIDHPFNFPGPANMAGGELEAHKSIKLEFQYPAGRYMAIWRGLDPNDDFEIIAVFEAKRPGLIVINPDYIEDHREILWQVADQFHLSNSLNDCLKRYTTGCESDSQCVTLAEKFCSRLLPDGCKFGSFGVECS